MVYPHAEDAPPVAVGGGSEAQGNSSLLRSRKRTLLLLRRGRRVGKGNIVFDPVDLRHQRTVDVVFAAYSENPSRGGRRVFEVDSLMQQSVYSMIETLVPRGEDGGLKNCNEYLQVFGKGSNGRPHWVVLLEEPCSVCANKHSNTDEKVGARSPAPSRSARDGRARARWAE